MKLEMYDFYWLNEPSHHAESHTAIMIQTEPGTDLWQRTHYGFRVDNAPAYVFKTSEADFTFAICTDFEPRVQYDQCGLLLYLDSDNWFKASIEYEDETIQRLGSVVTNLGYSDWATTDISGTVRRMHYRLSRRGSDFKLEHSYDGLEWHQMRVFHLHAAINEIRVGIYACSPKESSFQAHFHDLELSDCLWPEA